MSTIQEKDSAGAIAVLTEDHQTVENLFKAFEKADDADLGGKSTLVRRACELLTVHAMIEEEILYPAAREALPASDKTDVDEALVEHFLVKALIEKFAVMTADAEGFDATFKVLSENVRHHVEEEESELFPELRKTKLNLAELGRRLVNRKAELMAKLPSNVGDRT